MIHVKALVIEWYTKSTSKLCDAKCFCYRACSAWIILPTNIRQIRNRNSFTNSLKQKLMNLITYVIFVTAVLKPFRLILYSFCHSIFGTFCCLFPLLVTIVCFHLQSHFTNFLMKLGFFFSFS